MSRTIPINIQILITIPDTYNGDCVPTEVLNGEQDVLRKQRIIEVSHNAPTDTIRQAISAPQV
jgi:hypothetical protein